jgi:hypothetical protein
MSGELAKADALLEDIAHNQRRSVECSAINLAGTLARRAEIALTRLRYGEAAGHFASAAAVLPSEMDHDGERESGTSVLEEAVAAHRAALEERTRERVPLDWAQTQNNLGTAIRALGERESSTSRLEEAVTAYRGGAGRMDRRSDPILA